MERTRPAAYSRARRPQFRVPGETTLVVRRRLEAGQIARYLRKFPRPLGRIRDQC